MNVPIAYASDFREPSDWIDAGFLLASSSYDTVGFVAPREAHERLNALAKLCGHTAQIADSLASLKGTGWNIVATGYVDGILPSGLPDKQFLREKTSRIFVVGGLANHPTRGAVPIHPRLEQLHPERFGPGDDPRWDDSKSWNRLLASGEGVIWLPRDICLWRFDAVGMLSIEPNPLTHWLLGQWDTSGPRGESIVLMSTTPAFCLASAPDPALWLRLFRTQLVRVEVDAAGDRCLELAPASPNAHAVLAVDGAGLNQLLASRLRGAFAQAVA